MFPIYNCLPFIDIKEWFQYYTITALERDQYEVLCSIKPHIDQVQV